MDEKYGNKATKPDKTGHGHTIRARRSGKSSKLKLNAPRMHDWRPKRTQDTGRRTHWTMARMVGHCETMELNIWKI